MLNTSNLWILPLRFFLKLFAGLLAVFLVLAFVAKLLDLMVVAIMAAHGL